MNRIHLFLIFCFSLSISHSAYSQISIGPEIGISTFPFKLLSSPGPDNQYSNLAISYGIFGIIPMSKSINMKVSISYADRKDLCRRNGGALAINSRTHYSSNDLSMDLSISYKLKERLFSGIGFSSVYKLNSWIGWGADCDPDSILVKHDMSHLQYALHASIEYHWKHLIASFVYARFLRVEYLGNFGLSGKIGLNRYDLRIAYPIRFQSSNAGK